MKNVIRLTESDFVNLIQRTIEEQMASQPVPGKPQPTQRPVPGKPQPAQQTQRPVFAPSHTAFVEVDCKSKLVRISKYPGKFNKQANANLVDIFCNPQNRA